MSLSDCLWRVVLQLACEHREARADCELPGTASTTPDIVCDTMQSDHNTKRPRTVGAAGGRTRGERLMPRNTLQPRNTPQPRTFADFGGVAAIGTAEQRAKPTTEPSLDGKCLLVLEAGEHGTCAARILDERDGATVAERMARLDERSGPRVGDFLRFANGVERRISHYWGAEPDVPGWRAGVQTSDGGSWHLGEGGCSFSGGLYPLVALDTLTDTGETRNGSAWIFHHGHRCAGGGVDFLAPFRVFTCSEEAPR
jgi:hypothetical protein